MALESTPTWLIGPAIPPAARLATVLSGTYRLDAFLGQGMTGITYNAWHLRQKAPYAVKLLHRELAPTHERVIRLRQDLRALAGLGRLGFLPVELSFAPDGAPFLAAELLTGDTLRQRLQRSPMPVLAAGMLVAALCRALGPAHQQGVVHGDLRPENVFVPSQAGQQVSAGQPVLLDGALHHLRKRPIGLDESLPLTKLAYLSPEQASGEVTGANIAGDVFALGAILYECLTGRQAFGGSEMEVVLEKLSRPPAALELPRESGAPPGLSVGLDVVVAGACARDPEARIPTMAMFLDGLMQAFEGAGLPLPPPGEAIPTPADGRAGRQSTVRRSTVAVKKVLPVRKADTSEAPGGGAPGSETPEAPATRSVSGVRPVPVATTGTGAAAAGPAAPASGPVGAPRPRPTMKAKDISKLVQEVQAGLLPIGKMLADEPAPESKPPMSEMQRQLEAGKAAVLARAEAARARRLQEESARRDEAAQQAAREAKGRVLEAARAEVLGKMRAELDEKAARARAERDAAAAELSRLEAERTAVAQREAEQAERARKESERAERARKEAEQAEVARQEAERQEAERREAERQETERAEAALRLAQDAERQRSEAERQRQLAEEALLLAQRAVEEALLLAQGLGPAGEPGQPEPMAGPAQAAAAKAAQEAERARALEEHRAQAAVAARETARQAEMSRLRESAQLKAVESRAQAARAKGEARLLAVTQAERAMREAEEARARETSNLRRVTQVLTAVRQTLEVDLIDADDADAATPAAPTDAATSAALTDAATPAAPTDAATPAAPTDAATPAAPADAATAPAEAATPRPVPASAEALQAAPGASAAAPAGGAPVNPQAAVTPAAMTPAAPTPTADSTAPSPPASESIAPAVQATAAPSKPAASGPLPLEAPRSISGVTSRPSMPPPLPPLRPAQVLPIVNPQAVQLASLPPELTSDAPPEPPPAEDEAEEESPLEQALHVSSPGTQPRRSAEPISLPGLQPSLDEGLGALNQSSISMMMPVVPAPGPRQAQWMVGGALGLLALAGVVLAAVIWWRTQPPGPGPTDPAGRSRVAQLPDMRRAPTPAADREARSTAVQDLAPGPAPRDLSQAPPDLGAALDQGPRPDLTARLDQAAPAAVDLRAPAAPADLAVTPAALPAPVPAPAVRHRRTPPDPRIPPLRTMADQPLVVVRPPPAAPAPRPTPPTPPAAATPAAPQPPPPDPQAAPPELRNPF